MVASLPGEVEGAGLVFSEQRKKKKKEAKIKYKESLIHEENSQVVEDITQRTFL